MKYYTFLVWLRYKYNGNSSVLRLLDEMTKSQWMAEDLIYSYQLDCFRELIDFARLNTRYYHDLFYKIGLASSNDIMSLGDIKSIPPLSKATLQENLDSLTVQSCSLVENQTGGSTGMPLHFYNNKAFAEYEKVAASNWAYSIAGYRIGEPMAIIWGFDKDIAKLKLHQKILNKYTFKFYQANSFNMTDENIIELTELIKKYKIKFVKGYANSLAEVSHYILAHDITFNHKIEAVFSEAEILTGENRKLISQAFQSHVYNLYGSREFGTIAVECPVHMGLHINSLQLFAEIGDENNILITSFRNLGTIFIRYEIGDSADKIITDKCSCGRSSRRLQRILGRTSDNFISPDGKFIHGEYVTHLFYGTKQVKQFQIIQNTSHDFEFNIVPAKPGMCETEINSIIAKMQNQFNASLNVKVNYVSSIDKTKTGKRKFTVCNVKAIA